MKKILFTIATLNFLAAGIAVSQTKRIEKIEKKGSEVVIPYEKYVLPNGLTLLIHEDHSDPVVQVDVTYHVGSAREEVGKSGFAHFFEHMMFQGSDHVGDDQHFKIVTEAGGTLNGSTNLDRTNYFETLPVNQLETALWLEADRMGFLLDAVTQKKFEIQRATVKNERGQRYDNAPYGLVFENIAKATYPYGHPYSWPTIGYLEDLDRVNVEDLKKFFLRWYGPNNATLTVGGDVNPKEVIKLVEKYFGSIPRGPEVKRASYPAPVIKNNRYVSYEDNNIRFPALVMNYPAVPFGHPDEPALDCLAEILGQGKNSIFYKNFVKSQKAVSASVFVNTTELAGSIMFYIRSFPTFTLKQMDSLVKSSLAEFEKTGVTDDALQRFKAQYESSTINSLASVSGKVFQLANNQTLRGNPNLIGKDLAEHNAVTKEDVMRVYNKYLKGKGGVILSVYPKGKKENVVAPDNFKMDSTITLPPGEDYSKLVYKKAQDNFDRSKKPESGQNPVVKVPDFFKNHFDNGVNIIGTRNTEIPSVTIQISIDGGHRAESMIPDKAGVSSLMAKLMNEGTKTYTSEELNNELDKLGSSISVSGGDENMVISINSLTKNLSRTLALAEDMMYHPRFAQEDFDRLKKQQLEGIAQAKQQPVSIANNVFNKLIYGENDIMAISNSGTETTVKNITLDDVKKFYQEYFTPFSVKVVIVGDMDEAAAMKSIEFLKKWNGKPAMLLAAGKRAAPEKTKIYLINKDKAPQSEIRIGYLTKLPYDATGEYYKANLMNYILGGSFNSRINMNLREDKGYTYGARSGFASTFYPGPFTASAGVIAKATDSSVAEFMKEIVKYRNEGITKDEWSFTQKSIGQRDALKYETPDQKAGFLKQILQYNLPKDFVEKQNVILNSMTIADVNEVAKKYLPVESMIILVVGDAASNKSKLEALGYEVLLMDTDGKVLGN